jgi:hypothetical protein
MTPVSLLASITATSAGRGSVASSRSSAARSTTPPVVTEIRSAFGAAASTESCSMAETNSRARPLQASARLLASVPPDVNTICAGLQPASAATCSLAVSMAARARRPKLWTEDGLPVSAWARAMASAAAGRSGAVAL